MDDIEIAFSASLYPYDKETIINTVTFKVVNKTDKAVLIETIIGMFWIPKIVLESIFSIRNLDARYGPAECNIELRRFIRKLELNFSKPPQNALVLVKKVGNGPTDKSLKIKFQATHLNGSDESVTKTHIFTLPASQMVCIDSETYYPLWLLKKKFIEPVKIEYKSLGGFEALKEQIFDAYNNTYRDCKEKRDEFQKNTLRNCDIKRG